MQKLLDIKPLGQRNSQWASQRLGTVDGVTIGSDGCVVTSHCMSLTYHGKPFLPNTLDDFLTDNKLYAQGDLWVPSNSTKIYPEYKYIGEDVCNYDPAPIAKIKAKIDAGQPPTLWLINGGEFHNVLAVGYEGDKIKVNDPWMGDQVFIEDRWGASSVVILAVDYYEGPIINSTPLPPMDNEAKMRLRAKYSVDVLLNHLKDLQLKDPKKEVYVSDSASASEKWLDDDSNPKFIGLIKRIIRDYQTLLAGSDQTAIRKEERNKTLAEGIDALNKLKV